MFNPKLLLDTRISFSLFVCNAHFKFLEGFRHFPELLVAYRFMHFFGIFSGILGFFCIFWMFFSDVF